MTLNNISNDASDNIDKTFAYLDEDKTTCVRINVTTSLNSSAINFYLNSTGYNSTAGHYADNEVIDMQKTQSDFSSYKNNMLTYINNLSFNTTVNETGAVVEIKNQEEEANLAHSNMPRFYVYASRYNVGNYYKKYHYYFFYFSLKDGNLHLIRDKTPNGLLNGAYTSPLWPIYEFSSNNMQSHTLGSQSVSSSYGSNLLTNRYSRSYFRFVYNFINNNNTYNGVGVATYYANNTFTDLVDSTKTQDDYSYDALTTYLIENNNHYNNLGTDRVQFATYNDANYPYLYFLLSRRITNDSKYYYYMVNMFYFVTGDNSSNNNSIRLANQFKIQTALDSASSENIWFSISTHSETASSNPSKFSKSHIEGASRVYFDFSYYDNTNTLKVLNNQSFGILGNIFGDYGFDVEFNSSLSNNYNNDDIYNTINDYNIYYNIDNDMDNVFGAYLSSDNNWYFTGVYFRENYPYKLKFNAKYAFNSSLYNYKRFSTYTSTSDVVKTVTTSDMDSSYYLKNTNILTISTKEAPIIEYIFVNGSNNVKKYYLYLGNMIGVKAKYQAKNFFDKIASDNIDFTYHINLVPKSDAIKQNYKIILKCFTFDLDISIKSDEVLR